jgi:hypothetical protein
MDTYGFTSSRPLPILLHIWVVGRREGDVTTIPQSFQRFSKSAETPGEWRKDVATLSASQCAAHPPRHGSTSIRTSYTSAAAAAGTSMRFTSRTESEFEGSFVDFFYDKWELGQPFEHLGPLVQQFENLEELVILMMDKTKSQMRTPDTCDWMFVDCTEAEVLSFSTEFVPLFRHGS